MRLAPLVLVAACSSGAPPPLPQEPGLDGLRAHLEAARAAPERAVDGWTIPEARWRDVVTDEYVDHWDGYEARMRAARGELVAAIARANAAPRTHYVDDPAISGPVLRLRWVTPVGRPGAVVDGIPAVFHHDGAAWRALVSLDTLVTDALPADCRAAYLDSATKRCQERSYMIGAAALGGEDPARACGNATAIGCGAR